MAVVRAPKTPSAGEAVDGRQDRGPLDRGAAPLTTGRSDGDETSRWQSQPPRRGRWTGVGKCRLPDRPAVVEGKGITPFVAATRSPKPVVQRRDRSVARGHGSGGDCQQVSW